MSNIGINGLVLLGGLSKRFGSPKGNMLIGGKLQYTRMYALLAEVCNNVYYSLNTETRQFYPNIKEEQIVYDKEISIGPMSGLIAAMSEDRHSAWLLVSVDLVFLTPLILQILVENLDSKSAVISFKNDRIQPLCTLYKPKAYDYIIKNYNKQEYSLYKTIMTMPHTLLNLGNNDGADLHLNYINTAKITGTQTIIKDDHEHNPPHKIPHPLTNINTRQDLITYNVK